jgi:hypothetical protein
MQSQAERQLGIELAESRTLLIFIYYELGELDSVGARIEARVYGAAEAGLEGGGHGRQAGALGRPSHSGL